MLDQLCGCCNKNTDITVLTKHFCQRTSKVTAAAITIWLAAVVLIIRRIQRNDTDMHGSSCESYHYPCQILMKLEFSPLIFEEYSKLKCDKNPSSGSRVVPYGRTDRQTCRS